MHIGSLMPTRTLITVLVDIARTQHLEVVLSIGTANFKRVKNYGGSQIIVTA